MYLRLTHFEVQNNIIDLEYVVQKNDYFEIVNKSINQYKFSFINIVSSQVLSRLLHQLEVNECKLM